MNDDLLEKKPTEEESKKPLFDDDRDTEVYDDVFDRSAPLRKADTPEEINDKEEEAGAPSGDTASGQETSALGDRLGSPGFWKGGNEKGRPRRAKQLIKALAKNRAKAAIGGGVVTVVATIIFASFNLLSFEAIHVRENMLGKSNGLVNSVLQRRRAKNFSRMVRQLNKGKLTNKINAGKMAARLEANGFRLDFDADGKLKKLDFAPDGDIKKSFDFNEPDLRKATNEFFGVGDIGKEISAKFDASVGIRASTWKGRAARRLYGGMRTLFNPWPDRELKKADPNDPNEQFAEVYRGQDLEEAQRADAKATIKSGDRLDEDGDGKADNPVDEAQTEPFDKINDQIEDSAGKYGELIDDPTKSADELLDIPKGTNAFGGALKGLLTKDLTPGSIRQLAAALGTRFPALAGKLGKRAVNSINVTDYIRTACRVKGTLGFIGNVRNVYVSLQLAKFAIRFLTAADNQKAGLIQTDGLAIVMNYLHNPSPVSGRSYSQAGGFQNVIMGDKSAIPDTSNFGRYSTGRGNPGVFGSIANFFESIPQSAGTCRTVNNGFVQLGGFVVGIGLAIFSGGSITTGQVAIGLGLGLAEELVFLIGEPLITRSVMNLVIDGFEDGEMAGDALGSGWGALRGMNAGANGTRPARKSEIGQIQAEYAENLAYERSQQGLFERYLDPHNTESLVANGMYAASASNGLAYARNPASFFSNIFTGLPIIGSLSSKVSAASAPECDDPQIKANDIEADIFCNPEMVSLPDLDTDQTELILRDNDLIDSSGQPKGDFLDYISECHAGRPGILYDTKVDKNGGDDPENNTCISDGDKLSGDTVGQYLRFTDWYGYITDEENIIEDINEDYTLTTGPTSQPTNTNTAPTNCSEVTGPVTIDQTTVVRGITVHKCIAAAVEQMLAAAEADGVKLGGTGWRDPKKQIELRKKNCGETFYAIYLMPPGDCTPDTARPGASMHERGLAIDFTYNGKTLCYPLASTLCKGNAGFNWLVTNASSFGFKNLPTEAWHWSVSGG